MVKTLNDIHVAQLGNEPDIAASAIDCSLESNNQRVILA